MKPIPCCQFIKDVEHLVCAVRMIITGVRNEDFVENQEVEQESQNGPCQCWKNNYCYLFGCHCFFLWFNHSKTGPWVCRWFSLLPGTVLCALWLGFLMGHATLKVWRKHCPQHPSCALLLTRKLKGLWDPMVWWSQSSAGRWALPIFKLSQGHHGTNWTNVFPLNFKSPFSWVPSQRSPCLSLNRQKTGRFFPFSWIG